MRVIRTLHQWPHTGRLRKRHRVSIGAYAKSGRFRWFSLQSSSEIYIVKATPRFSEDMERGLLRAEVDRALGMLNYEHRAALILHFFEGLQPREVARRMESSLTVTLKRIDESKKRLLARIEDDGLRSAIRTYIYNIHSPPIQAADAVELVERLTPELIAWLKSHCEDLQKLKPDVFEHLVAEFLKQRGFADVRLLAKKPFSSADIYAVFKNESLNENIRYFVEVKRCKQTVGINVINQVYGSMDLERPKWGWNRGLIVSLSGFTATRKLTAHDIQLRGITLKNGDDVRGWLNEYFPSNNGLWLPYDSATNSDNLLL